ncbi:hypothetical protein HYFRA_00014108 [Hymenoscyphus fraxineus]|uniref:Uncharacterized protein n=1 Tax=Hymenoscyphus fraxineus TaxID=746836 RepID=A0A9N9Q017_9HELO|nr:hypothetical protein HYFRA_00014108 [Hymenoscyphus fraxineus]
MSTKSINVGSSLVHSGSSNKRRPPPGPDVKLVSPFENGPPDEDCEPRRLLALYKLIEYLKVREESRQNDININPSIGRQQIAHSVTLDLLQSELVMLDDTLDRMTCNAYEDAVRGNFRILMRLDESCTYDVNKLKSTKEAALAQGAFLGCYLPMSPSIHLRPGKSAEYQYQRIPLSGVRNSLEPANGLDLAFTENFQENYGQYCITGLRRRSTFLAVSTYTSENKEELDRYVAGVAASFKTPKFSLGAAAKFEISHATSMSSIKEHHKINVVGIDTKHISLCLSTVDLQNAWESFIKYFKPTPYLALLTPYIDLKIPLPRPKASSIIPREFQEASDLVFALRLAAQAHSMTQARIATDKVISQSLSVCDIQSWLVLPPSQNAVSITRLRSIQTQLATIWHERLMLLTTWDSFNKTANEWGWFDWNKAGHTKAWRIGLCPDGVPQAIRSDITIHDHQWHPRSKGNGLPECDELLVR